MSLVNYILQTASITLLYVVGFLGGMHLLGLVTLSLLFFYTPLWPFVILYLSWMYLVEWKTPQRGGRDLLRNFTRRLSVFKYMSNYFPITLVKTSELDPQKNYIFGYHPHGMFTEGASLALNTEACGFSEKFPGIIPHVSVHSSLLMAWLYRDVLMSLGVIDVTRESLEYALTQKGAGHSVIIVVGGAAEILDTRFDSYVLVLKRRKGFIKLALETGCDLVPVFGFGQNNLFHVFGGGYYSRYSRFQRWLRSKTQSGCFYCWGACMLPSRSPINVVVGSPIPVRKVANPSQEEIDKLHSRYIEDLKQLYEKYKDKYHPTDSSELLIV